MKAFESMRSRLRAGRPPARSQTLNTLDRPATPPARRVKTGRTEQLNFRVTAAFKRRIDQLAEAEQQTLGALLEKMTDAFQAGASRPDHDVPPADAQAGRTHFLRLWVTLPVYKAIGRVANERELTIAELIEDMLAREVARLDPHGGKFDVHVNP
jgi:predicted DNA-binding ribbon-helix-helix protein